MRWKTAVTRGAKVSRCEAIKIHSQDGETQMKFDRALKAGLSEYQPDKPCRNGHRSKRIIQDKGDKKRSACIDCLADGNKRRLARGYNKTLSDLKSPITYDQLSANQGGICAICRKTGTEKGGKLHVDHCHATKKIRGLLCGRCNKGIGLLKDSEELLLRAVNYLKDSPAKNLLQDDHNEIR